MKVPLTAKERRNILLKNIASRDKESIYRYAMELSRKLKGEAGDEDKSKD